jgi:hypothetical protein
MSLHRKLIGGYLPQSLADHVAQTSASGYPAITSKALTEDKS